MPAVKAETDSKKRVWMAISASEDSSEESPDDEPFAKTGIRRTNKPVGKTGETSPKETGLQPFQSMMKESFNNPKLSDITIFLNGFSFPAHSFVLAAQSTLFKDTLSQSRQKKGAVKEFRYDQDHRNATAYWRMFEYMYKGDYSVKSQAKKTMTEDDSTFLHRHSRVYVLAEEFGIDGLKQMATDRFVACAKEHPANQILIDCASFVCGKTKVKQNMLRKAVMEIVHKNVHEFWKIKAFRILLHKGGDFSVEFAAKLLGTE